LREPRKSTPTTWDARFCARTSLALSGKATSDYVTFRAAALDFLGLDASDDALTLESRSQRSSVAVQS
jgi:hypothetical protein